MNTKQKITGREKPISVPVAQDKIQLEKGNIEDLIRISIIAVALGAALGVGLGKGHIGTMIAILTDLEGMKLTETVGATRGQDDIGIPKTDKFITYGTCVTKLRDNNNNEK